LAALDSALSDISLLPEKNRIVVRGAINRIKDIANNLLIETQENPKDASNRSANVRPILISALIESIISEKRFQLRTRPEILIDSIINSQNFHAFSNIDSAQIKTILSNLINNSVDAARPNIPLTIDVVLTVFSESIEISIIDNGIGLHKDLLLDFQSNKFKSFGKENSSESGSGIGLKSASQYLNLIGGKLRFENNTTGQGLKVSITLQRSPAPAWFATEIILENLKTVYIVDDDQSIHDVWKEKFRSLATKSQNIHQSHFNDVYAFEKHLLTADLQSSLILIDQEFLNQQMTGLELIAKHNLSAHSILVSSRYDEPLIRDSATRLNLKLLPKNLVIFIPIHFSKPNSVLTAERLTPDFVLLDDDSLIHLLWKAEAENMKKNGLYFKHMDELHECIHKIDQDTPIYVDQNLGNNSDKFGTEILNDLYQMGFRNLYLCTGDSNTKQSSNFKVTGKGFLGI